MDYEDFALAGRKIQELSRALEEVEQFHQIESSLQVDILQIVFTCAFNFLRSI